MGISMKIHNIKSISDFEFEIPTTKGLYALTGENASGKSTVLSCISTLFYMPTLYLFFGAPYDNSEILFKYDKKERMVSSFNNRWYNPVGNLGVTGFYEGSIVFGNRFKDVDFKMLKKLSSVSKSKLNDATNFIKDNLGLILHDDKSYYNDLYIFNDPKNEYSLQRPSFYVETNGFLINQLNMSTGENLLLTILYSIELRINKNNYGDLPTFILLDEIELALHSSALRRLVIFLADLAENHNFIVFFSTHSIELIRSISPNNIFYLQRYADNSIEIINPCYPVYATRNLESSNYGHDYIILVEDELAKQVVDKILVQQRLLSNKRVLVIAVGGWNQVLRFAYDTIRSNLMLKTTKILIVLDRDIKDDVPDFMKKQRINFAVKPHYLPIKSVEKYLLENLVEIVNHSLFMDLNDYIFQGKSLNDIVQEYIANVKNDVITDKERIKNGKAFYDAIRSELRQIRKSENELIQILVDHLFSNSNSELDELTDFLKKQFTFN